MHCILAKEIHTVNYVKIKETKKIKNDTLAKMLHSTIIM